MLARVLVSTQSKSAAIAWAPQLLHHCRLRSTAPVASSSKLPPPRPSHAAPPTLASLDDLLSGSRPSRTQLLSLLLSLPEPVLRRITHPTFLALWRTILPDSAKATAGEPGKTWKALRFLRDMAQQRQWTMDERMVRDMVLVGIRAEEIRRAHYGKRKKRFSEREWDPDLTLEEKMDKEREHRSILQQLLDELVTIIERAEGASEAALKDSELILRLSTLYSTRQRVLLFPGDPSFEQDTTLSASQDLYDYAGRLSSRKKPSPLPSPAASSILSNLFMWNPPKAIRHLQLMLDRDELPTPSTILHLIRPESSASPTSDSDSTPLDNHLIEDSYARARRVLDEACSAGPISGTHKLDELLEERLKALEKEELVDKEPMLAFIRWIALQLPMSENGPRISQEDALLTALRLWENIYIHREGDVEGSEVPLRPAAIEILVQLVRHACVLASVRPPPPSPGISFTRNSSLSLASASTPSRRIPGPFLSLAISLATTHLPPWQLVSHSHRLFQAVCVDSPSPLLAHQLYVSLRKRAPPDSEFPFRWHAALIRTVFIFLMRAAVDPMPRLVHDRHLTPKSFVPSPSPKGPLDESFALQLYLDLTADGLLLPKGLSGTLWRALGVRGSVEETARVLGDFTASGRIDPRVSGIVLVASARAGYVTKTLRLLHLFQSRYPNGTGGFLVDTSLQRKLNPSVPIRAYNTILQLLASTYQDRRSDSLRIFRQMVSLDGIKPDIETWNALLAMHVFRPRLTPQDLDGAGRVYNSLVSESGGIVPDGMSYSLLIHGFLRLSQAREGHRKFQKTRLGAEAALRTFNVAEERGVRVRGEQTAQLMVRLARFERWEDAKGVGERWWRLRLREEESGSGIGSVRGEGEEEIEQEEKTVKEAGEKVARWEGKARAKELREMWKRKTREAEREIEEIPEDEELDVDEVETGQDTTRGAEETDEKDDDKLSPHRFDLSDPASAQDSSTELDDPPSSSSSLLHSWPKR